MVKFILILFLSAAVLGSGCVTTTERDKLAPTAEPTRAELQMGNAIISELHAVLAARSAIGISRLHLLGEPRAALVEQMTLARAQILAGKPTNAGTDPTLATQVWFVVLEADYQIFPPGPGATPLPQRHGCVYAILNSQDGKPLQVGGEIPCPTQQ